ncbi:hypothetical protein ERO13_D11G087420v2 [Gossypium hirsutum]|nr:hypothetical protein ERO13_D11G087420v2 [Gossypium hirsutum]
MESLFMASQYSWAISKRQFLSMAAWRKTCQRSHSNIQSFSYFSLCLLLLTELHTEEVHAPMSSIHKPRIHPMVYNHKNSMLLACLIHNGGDRHQRGQIPSQWLELQAK